MAENTNVNKVVYGNNTLIDLTSDSVTSETLLEGETAHDRSGAGITGTAKQGHIIQNNSGTNMTQRAKMQFLGLSVSDDSENDKTIIEHNINNDSPTFTQASTRSNIASGDSISTLFGKIKKYFTDLKDLAFIAKDGTSSTKYLRGDGSWQEFPTIPDISTKVSKSGDTMSGDLTVDKQNGTASAVGTSRVILGNATPSGTAGNSRGGLRIYGAGAYYGDIYDNTGLTDNRGYYLPDKSGTLALTSDIPTDFVSKASGGTFGGNISVNQQDGTTSGVGQSQLTLGNNIAQGTSKNSKGILNIYGSGAYKAIIAASNVSSSNKTFELPNKSGTIALTSDIPTNVSSLNNDSGFITSSGSCASATTASKLGSSTLGGSNQPIYLNSGTPTKCNSFVPSTGGTFNAAGGSAGSESWTTITIGNSTGAATAKNSAGRIRLYRGNGTSATTAYYTELRAGANTANRTITFPNKGGTVALTSDIPSSLPANGGTADQSIALNYSGTGNSQFTVAQTDGSFMGRSGWATYLLGNHGNGASNYCQALALPFWGPPMYQRREGGELRGWKEFITEENIASKISQGIYTETIAMSFSGNYATYTKTENIIILSIELANTDNTTYGVDFSWTRWSDWKTYRVCAMSQNALLTGSYWVDVVYIKK